MMTASEEYAQAAGESPMKGAPVIEFDKFKPTRSMIARRKRKDAAMGGLISVAFIVALIPLFSVLWTTIVNGVKRLNLNFLSYNMSGVIGVDPAVQKPVEGGTLAQARQAFENITTVLGELGATMNDVLKTTVYLTDIGEFGEVNKLYAQYFGPDFPARTCVEVSRLPMGLSIEVECIARAKD